MHRPVIEITSALKSARQTRMRLWRSLTMNPTRQVTAWIVVHRDGVCEGFLRGSYVAELDPDRAFAALKAFCRRERVRPQEVLLDIDPAASAEHRRAAEKAHQRFTKLLGERMKTDAIKAKHIGRRFVLEIPPVDWILKFENYMLGRGKNGFLYVVDHYSGDGAGVGWTVQKHRNFHRMMEEGSAYTNPFFRAAAHKLGIKTLPWTNGNPELGPVGKTIQVPVDDYFRDLPLSHEKGAKKAHKAHLAKRKAQLAS